MHLSHSGGRVRDDFRDAAATPRQATQAIACVAEAGQAGSSDLFPSGAAHRDTREGYGAGDQDNRRVGRRRRRRGERHRAVQMQIHCAGHFPDCAGPEERSRRFCGLLFQ